MKMYEQKASHSIWSAVRGDDGAWWLVPCCLATHFWPEDCVFFPSVSDCVQRHSHAGTEDTHAFREEVFYPLWEEEPGTGLVLPLGDALQSTKRL